ncbi:hypothetical protein [Acinetobacter shaoyimingii]|uniref:Uncharacterized protein n=1 Tax=Acinetobacter shaoyimingii TaxID=2715164 RepID=A0A6G8RR55_9GAMM|nr:hypothetical protein [Acinetobacter shaoyimingii]NHB57276.1 hypothetical protein [Acinetobacter shaoyimingii]QIO04449.1 hypothetical protein G8E00_09195 [Acinetobacter shaoyimingii]
MVQLIKKGGLRERANRSRAYQGSENTETTLAPHGYQHPHLVNRPCSTQHGEQETTIDTNTKDLDTHKK